MERVLLTITDGPDQALGVVHDLRHRVGKDVADVRSATVITRDADEFRVVDEMQDLRAGTVVAGAGAGALLGAIGGPLGALLGGMTGTVLGSVVEALDADDSALLLGAIAHRIPNGSAGAVLHLDEEQPDLVTSTIAAHGGSVQRWSVDDVVAELEAAGAVVEAMAGRAGGDEGR